MWVIKHKKQKKYYVITTNCNVDIYSKDINDAKIFSLKPLKCYVKKTEKLVEVTIIEIKEKKHGKTKKK